MSIGLALYGLYSFLVPFSGDARAALIDHLKAHAVRTDGPFTLRSGHPSEWYIDARQSTFDGEGAALVGDAVAELIDPSVGAVGGMTMGADPIAVAAAISATRSGRPLRAFSIRKTEKGHGAGGRIVGPVAGGDRVAVLEDTTTTGGALLDAVDVLEEDDVIVVQAIALVDRSGDAVARRLEGRGIAYMALVTPDDLGVGG